MTGWLDTAPQGWLRAYKPTSALTQALDEIDRLTAELDRLRGRAAYDRDEAHPAPGDPRPPLPPWVAGYDPHGPAPLPAQHAAPRTWGDPSYRRDAP